MAFRLAFQVLVSAWVVLGERQQDPDWGSEESALLGPAWDDSRVRALVASLRGEDSFADLAASVDPSVTALPLPEFVVDTDPEHATLLSRHSARTLSCRGWDFGAAGGDAVAKRLRGVLRDGVGFTPGAVSFMLGVSPGEGFNIGLWAVEPRRRQFHALLVALEARLHRRLEACTAAAPKGGGARHRDGRGHATAAAADTTGSPVEWQRLLGLMDAVRLFILRLALSGKRLGMLLRFAGESRADGEDPAEDPAEDPTQPALPVAEVLAQLAAIGMLVAAGSGVDARWHSMVQLAPVAEGGVVIATDFLPVVLLQAGIVRPQKYDPVMFLGPDSYSLTAAAPRFPHARSLLDLCTGSGVQGIVAAKLGVASNVVLVDANPRAVCFARFNVLLNGLATSRMTVLEGDLYDPLTGYELAASALLAASELAASNESSRDHTPLSVAPPRFPPRFDAILANPPFVPVPSHWGRQAMYADGGPDGGKILQRIIEGAPGHLAPTGRLVVVSQFVNVALEIFQARLQRWWGVGEASVGATEGASPQASRGGRGGVVAPQRDFHVFHGELLSPYAYCQQSGYDETYATAIEAQGGVWDITSGFVLVVPRACHRGGRADCTGGDGGEKARHRVFTTQLCPGHLWHDYHRPLLRTHIALAVGTALGEDAFLRNASDSAQRREVGN